MEFDRLFIKHYRACYQLLTGPLPVDVQSLDSTRTTLIQFALTGLGALNGLSILTNSEKEQITQFLLGLYIPGRTLTSNSHIQSRMAAGFRGSTLIGNPFPTSGVCASLISILYIPLHFIVHPIAVINRCSTPLFLICNSPLSAHPPPRGKPL